MYRGAIVGCGQVACAAHVPAWKTAKAFDIVAAVDPNPERLLQIRALLPEVRCYARLDTMLAHEELDFLDICTPPAIHQQIILPACRRGLHVLCEKPVTLSTAALQQITAATAAAGTLIFPVHNWKYAPLFQRLRRLLHAGAIGTPTFLELTTLRTGPAGTSGWRVDPHLAGGGILMDHGWHAFYLLRFLLEQVPQTITARLEQRRWQHIAVEDTAWCQITFPHAQASLYLTWAATQRCNGGVIRGTQGEIRLADDRLVVQRNNRTPQEIVFPRALSVGSYHPDWMTALLPDFHAALAAPRQYSVGLQEAESCLRLILLAYRSAAHNAHPLSCTQELRHGVTVP
jgi:predicted dehydrogenase